MAERLRAARRDDGARLAAIDAEGNPSPWSAEAFATTLRRAHGLVALDTDERIVGFIVFAVAADECEILGLGITPAARRRGYARALIDAALEQAGAAGAQRCFLEVRASNQAAKALYAVCGFRTDGRRKDYYRDGTGAREDALLLSRELDGAQA